MSEPKQITVELYTTGELLEPVHEVIFLLQNLIDTVPEEYRNAVVIELCDGDDYDIPSPQLRIFYNRMETQQEVDERDEKDAQIAETNRRIKIERARRMLAECGEQ